MHGELSLYLLFLTSIIFSLWLSYRDRQWLTQLDDDERRQLKQYINEENSL